MSRSATLLVNPSAGKGRSQARLTEVVDILSTGGWQVDTRLTGSFADAEAGAADALAGGVDALIVMGGDGMMHLGVNAVARQRAAGGVSATLGLVPAGTGNDLSRGLGMDPRDSLAAARVITGGRTWDIDLAEVNDRYVGTVLAAGFDALVNRRANALPWPKGQARYVVATLAELRVFSPLRYRMRIDGAVRELEAMLVAVGNTSSYGGGMRICPGASPTDGQLDLTIIHPVSRLKLLQLLPRMHSGRFVGDRCVEQLRATTVEIEGDLLGYGDGELIGPAPLRVRIAPKAVSVFAAGEPLGPAVGGAR